jgi:hypothetical protein
LASLGQAVPTLDGPDFFDVEWSKTSPAIVRVLRSDGRQIWTARLSAMGSPETLKRKSLAPVGRAVSQEGQQANIDQMLLLDGGSIAALRNSPESKAKAVPLNGQSILVHDCGDNFGGLLLLERGSSDDSLIDLGSRGSETWRYRSAGRLTDSWTVNFEGDVGIVETLADPPTSSPILLNGKTGEVRFRIPFATSSTTIKGLKCIPGNALTNIRPSRC